MTQPTRAAPARLPAGALLLVVVVSIIVAAILLSLLLLTSNRRLLVQRDAVRQAVRRNAYSGLAYAQAHAAGPSLRRQAWDLFGEGTDSVTLVRKPWGVFDVAVVTAAKGRWSDTVVALLGSQFSAVNNAALYLANENVPLSVGDDAQVRGTAYLPKAEPARSANLPLAGPRRTGAAVTNALRPSQAKLPVNGDSALARLRGYAELQLQQGLPADIQPSGDFRSRQTPFAGPPTVLYDAKPVVVAGLMLAGQIVVVSSRRLVVEASSQLDNVLLLAPVVVVRAGFRGRVQIIARDTVDVQRGCELLYPSAVCTYSTTGAGLVLLGENSRVSGVVIAAQPAGAARPCTVRMGPGAAVQGQVFSAGTVENCGAVRGTLMCRRLVYRTAATFYDNYLINAVLDRPGLPAAFLTTALLNEGARTGVIAWLR